MAFECPRGSGTFFPLTFGHLCAMHLGQNNFAYISYQEESPKETMIYPSVFPLLLSGCINLLRPWSVQSSALSSPSLQSNHHPWSRGWKCKPTITAWLSSIFRLWIIPRMSLLMLVVIQPWLFNNFFTSTGHFAGNIETCKIRFQPLPKYLYLPRCKMHIRREMYL